MNGSRKFIKNVHCYLLIIPEIVLLVQIAILREGICLKNIIPLQRGLLFLPLILGNPWLGSSTLRFIRKYVIVIRFEIINDKNQSFDLLDHHSKSYFPTYKRKKSELPLFLYRSQERCYYVLT